MTERKRGFERVKGIKRGEVKMPHRSTEFSAGYDMYASEDTVVPSMLIKALEVTEANGGKITPMINMQDDSGVIEVLTKQYGLRPTLVPTGIKAYMQDDEYLQLVNRSSGSYKRGVMLGNGVAVIDSDYYSNKGNDGEIYFQLLNFLPFDIMIKKGESLGQGIFLKYGITDDDNAKGERVGGHGSTDE